MTTNALPVEQMNNPIGDGADPEVDEAPVPGEKAVPLWERWSRESERSPRPARWLAEVRRGGGKKAGSVPALWPLYQQHQFRGEDFDDDLELTADHICMVLFAIHQQSQHDPMHRRTVTFGTALRRLRGSDRFRDRESALDARVYAAATASGVAELETHLRSVIRLLKDEGIGFDYSSLYRDLVEWLRPGGADRVRQRWGRDYYWRPPKGAAAPSAPASSKGQSS